MCGMHRARVRRYGDANYTTPEIERRIHSREANSRPAKEDTYKKYLGRHEHRSVAEKMMGRPLLPNEHVHHIDLNKHNNTPENLIVMSRSEHLALHARLKC